MAFTLAVLSCGTTGRGSLLLCTKLQRFRSALMPDDAVRTAMAVMLPYTGRNADKATNLWREWYQKYSMSRADIAGNPIKTFITVPLPIQRFD